MFCRLAGTALPLGTEKQWPHACPGWWYGSWPTMTTLTCSSGVVRDQEWISWGGG